MRTTDARKASTVVKIIDPPLSILTIKYMREQ
jgi:hypothetical protein